MGREYTYKGLIELISEDKEDEVLHLNSTGSPIAETLSDLHNKFCTVRYYISDKEISLEEAQEEFFKKIIGDINAEYGVCYTETTGCLWTTEELRVGGHDLLDELRSYVGKYLILIVEINDDVEEVKEHNNNLSRLQSTISLMDSYSRELGLSRAEALELYDSEQLLNFKKNMM